MDGVCGGEYYTSKPWWSCGKIYTPDGPSSGLKGSILFLETVNFVFLGMNKKQRSCNGRGARSAPCGVLIRPKRRVRAAHGARAAKTH